MEFRIADTFTGSLARLTGEEQKAAKTTAFDLQLDPARPGMRFHRIDGAKDKNFWSVRVSRDIRLIVHRTVRSLLLCFVGHHDAAYRWAERRRLETHPRTGAAQLVEIRETVREIEVPRYVEAEARDGTATGPTERIFDEIPEDMLLGFGVPVEWMPDVRGATEDSLLDIAPHLPAEAAEALLEIATGGTPSLPAAVAAGHASRSLRPVSRNFLGVREPEPPAYGTPAENPFEHPDAQRRFRVMGNSEELEWALEHPWEKWTVFLHPEQRRIVERSYHGPARIAGSAGTGKTVVALHRAVQLARTHPESRILLATYSRTLAVFLQDRLRRLVGRRPRAAERIEVYSIGGVCRRLYESNFGRPTLAAPEQVRELIDQAASDVEKHRFRLPFLVSEWNKVVDAWQIETWEDYRDVVRLGRKTRLAETQRVVLWSIFSKVREALAERGLLTEPALFRRLEQHFSESRRPPFDFYVVDEAQDIGVAELRFLAALGRNSPNSLFFAGDLGQRIFRTPFSWRALGVDVRGRAHTLRINYRTSHQIRRQADRLLPKEISDVDGIAEQRHGTISVFNGPKPVIKILGTLEEESACVADWLNARRQEGYEPHEIAVFVRSQAEVKRAINAVEDAGLSAVELTERPEGEPGCVAVGTMHLAKGLEFRGVVVAACDDEVLPLQARIESITDEADLEEVYNTERHLLYVACTRARDCLLVTGVAPASEYLEDLE